MATRRIEVEILGDASSLERAFTRGSTSGKAFEAQTAGIESRVSSLHQRLRADLIPALIGGGGVVFGLEQVVEAAKAAQESQDHLDVTMKDAGLSYDDNRTKIEAYLKKQSELSAFQQTDLRESFAALVRTTGDVNKSMDELSLASDIARGKHIDLSSATQVLVNIEAGRLRGLASLGIAVPKVTAAQDELRASGEKFTAAQIAQAKAIDATTAKQEAIAEIQKKYAGDAESYGNSAAGASDKFKVAITNLEIELGTALLPTLTAGLKGLSDWINHLNDSGDAARYVQDGVNLAKTAVRDVTPIVKLAEDAFKGLSDAVGGDKKALELLATAFATHKIIGTLDTLTTSLGKASSKAGGLKKNLGLLRALGPIAVVVALELVRGNKVGQGALDKVGLGWMGKLPLVGNVFQQDAGLGVRLRGGDTSTPQQVTLAQHNLTSTAIKLSGGIYQTGGIGEPNASGEPVYDCSGYLYEIYKKNGITIPRTSEAQFHDPNAQNVTGHEEPGDGVYFVGSSEYPPPGHCGIYMGNDQFIEYYSSGRPARWSKLSTYPGYMGARRWVKVVHESAGDTASSGSGAAATSTSADAASIVAAGKAKPTPVVTGDKLLSTTTQLALAKARGTAGTADDLTVLKQARVELEALQRTASKKEQVPIANELAKINQQINALDTAGYKKKLAEQTAATKAELAKQKAAWGAHVTDLKTIAATSKTTFERLFGSFTGILLGQFDRETQAGLAQMKLSFNSQVAVLDHDLKVRLSGIEATRVALTDSEQKLADLQAQHDEQGRQDAIASAQSDLDKALAAGDPQAVAQAQKALGDAQYSEQVATLQKQADAERKAADEKAATDAQAAQDEHDLQVQSAQDLLDAQTQNYQDQRDLQRDQLTLQLQDLEAHLEARNGTLSAKNDELLGIMRQFGLDPAWLTAGGNAGSALLAGLASAFQNAGDALGVYQSAQTLAGAAQTAGPLAVQAQDTAAAVAALLPGQSTVVSGGGTSTLLTKVAPGHVIKTPLMAEGGIALRPTVAVIGDNGPEAVIPLDRLTSTSGGGDVHFHGCTFLGTSKDDVARQLKPYLDRVGSL